MENNMSNPALDNLMGTMTARTDKVSPLVDGINETISKNIFRFGKQKGVETTFPTTIIMLGCGGTGSWLAPKLIKVLNDARNKGMISDTSIIFADGDEIEEKNLIRQNFVAADVTKNKAEVIATRYGQHVTKGIQVGFQDCFVVDDTYKIPTEHAEKFVRLSTLSPKRGGTLIINLIDNGKTRKMIHRYASRANRGNSTKRWSIVDVANNTYNGQLNYTCYGRNNPSTWMSQFYNQHPDHLGDNDDISLFSCADEDATAVEQLFNANDMAASVTCNFLNHWIAEGKLSYGQVKFTTGSAPSIENSVGLFEWSSGTSSNYVRMLERSEVGNATHKAANDATQENLELAYSTFLKECNSSFNTADSYLADLEHAACA